MSKSRRAALSSDRHGALISAASHRLLAALSSCKAYGWLTDESEGALVAIASDRNGVSIRAGAATRAAAEALCASDLARWTGGTPSGRKRLHITDAGRAYLARLAAPDGAEPFLAQHTVLARAKAEIGTSAMMDRQESPLVWLATRKGRNGEALIEEALLQAGERLRRDLTFGAMLPKVTANWSAVSSARGSGDAHAHFSDSVLAARQRVSAALAEVGPDLSGILMDVCGFLKGLSLIEGERQWPQRSAKVVLVLALRQLARHYGIEAVAVGPATSRLRRWGSEDYRPVIDPGPGPSMP